MKEKTNALRKWFLPKQNKTTDREIDMLNVKTIYYVSLVMCIVQTLALILFLISHHDDLLSPSSVNSIVNVSLSVALCFVGFIGSGYFKRVDDIADHHMCVNIFVTVFLCLMIAWGMIASVQTYAAERQIITFFVCELIAVMFIRPRPLITVIIILSSYVLYFIWLNTWVREGAINRYNFLMMALISAAGAVINYRMTHDYIEQKNKANLLNESLEIIANHDSITRLQNRYALNQNIPDYIDTDVCIAMGDINSFKMVNDTYGHQAGDDVLKAFAEILMNVFGREEIYRYGGDEFLIVSRSSDIEGFCRKLDLLNEEFGRVRINDRHEAFSCSFGSVAARPVNQADFFDLVMTADKKLYEAKSMLKAER